MSRIACIVFFVLLVVPCISDAETIDVQIKGVDDGAKTTKQRDYKEAVLFAKREAIERAGVKIKSMTTVRDMVVNSDYIESKAEAVLMPGYNILDMGYSSDGTYQIVLIGKVKTVSEGIDSKELRYAKSLMDRGEKAKAEKIITDIIENSKDDNAVAEAMYCQVLWKFASDANDTYDKLRAYYPKSQYVSRLKSVLAEREATLRGIESKIGRIKDQDGRFFLGAEGILLDTSTGLEWYPLKSQRHDYITCDWEEARKKIEALSIRGGGWRLPSKSQIRHLYNPSKPFNTATKLMSKPERSGNDFTVWLDHSEPDGYNGIRGMFFNFDNGKRYWEKLHHEKRSRLKTECTAIAVRSRR